MEHRGKLPSPRPEPARLGACGRPLSQRELLEQRFQQLSGEVDEREAFLRDMQVGAAPAQGWAYAGLGRRQHAC
jgi:hypothetical protein